MKKTFIINGESVSVEQLAFAKGEVSFTLNGKPYIFRGAIERDGRLVVKHEGRNRHGFVGGKNLKGAHPVMLDGGLEASVHLFKPSRKQGEDTGRPKAHTAPMAGTVQKVLVSQDAEVEAGQKLVIIEAMKLQLAIEAAYAGTVKKILCRIGGTVTEGDLLVEIEKAGGEVKDGAGETENA